MNEIRFNLPDRDYRDASGVSHSALKHMAVSPLHYKYNTEHPPERTQAMIIGTLFHLALFEPHKFALGVSHAVKPEGMSFATKDGKAWREQQTADIITADENASIVGMVQNMRANPTAAEWLADGCAEVSLFADDADTGLHRKGRCDWLVKSRPIMLDAKSCEDASAFEREAAQRKYHQQAAYYTDIAAANGVEIERFVFLVAEKRAPYGVRLVEFDDEAIQIGRNAYRAQLQTLAHCIRTNEWPGYQPTVERLRLPRWARSESESPEAVAERLLP